MVVRPFENRGGDEIQPRWLGGTRLRDLDGHVLPVVFVEQTAFQQRPEYLLRGIRREAIAPLDFKPPLLRSGSETQKPIESRWSPCELR